ncbi:MAG: hypothetical protein J7501_03855 [Bdellovibrio sp.]|nr:hypothetical protein [Bdellovibrio sp.]
MIKSAEIKGVDKVSKDFQRFLKACQNNPVILNAVGDRTVKYIRGSVRSAGRMDSDYKVGEVSPMWSNIRSHLAEHNTTHRTYLGDRIKDQTIESFTRKDGRDSHRYVYKYGRNKTNSVERQSTNKKSNLTFTGQLLDSMKFKIDSSLSRVKIYFEGMHTRYRNASGTEIGESRSNQDIANELNSNSKFHFLFVSGNLKNLLQSAVKAEMRRQLSNYKKFQRLFK